MKSKEFKCEMCRVSFTSKNTEEEIMEECVGNFGQIVASDRHKLVPICDDCYKIIDPKNHPDKVAKTILDYLTKEK